jgi:3-mercaptopyruvate sulfurtransferase SseA
MRYLVAPVAAIFAVVALAACNSTDRTSSVTRSSASEPAPVAQASPAAATVQATVAPGDGVRRMTIVELRDAMDKGQAIVVDTRGEDSYKAGHIKGARWIMATDILAHVNDLPRDKTIVTYCS